MDLGDHVAPALFGAGATRESEGMRPPAPSEARPVPGRAAFLEAYPDYLRTVRLDELRAEEYGYLDEGDHVYLDHAGAGLPARAQVRAHAARLSGGCFGHPHSTGPASLASSELVRRTRSAVLAHFNADPQEYAAIFTANATGACRLVGEAYPFGTGRRFVHLRDNHTCVTGIRDFARARGAAVDAVGLTDLELRGDEPGLAAALRRHGGRTGRLRPRRDGERGAGLFGYPAQSNFTGVQHPLDWIDLAHEHGFDVLLDAAAYAPANPVDLSETKPDFMPVSWYKLLGYPTGLGCLVARRDALARLRRPWSSGGAVPASGARGEWRGTAAEESAFEDGTPNFLSVPDVEAGLRRLSGIGLGTVNTRVRCLTGWLIDRLTTARHSTGMPLVRLYGPAGTEARGGTVAFNFLDPAGAVVDEQVVARDAAAHRISLRTGRFCNPGAGEAASNLDRAALPAPDPRTADALGCVPGRADPPTGGAVRVSLGPVSNLADVSRFVEFAVDTYLDRFPSAHDRSPRIRC
ncbi:selenocysteine lyase/cysteine desulfurase [Spinactinospora alkalitolerans]|uniref:Selenocysteine lyase/cysteine desulfurase n=1 Tax=Spinactinospora alkalitolerans TaxID=687207 RepID=A0A852U3D9_9ACTN|nr:aminotransferase class V-fold PLP-dependent enzyme [Spinactinospora alkalitolerans]NYE49982.1 selenocysteine lyase/cysteine desulfurase [Spinactinospora alkalitolerans]